MLSSFRAFAKSKVALVLIGLLIISFAVFQFSDTFGANPGGAVITAGDREITRQEFAAQFARVKQNMEQQNGGQPIPQDELIQRGVHMQMLEQMAADEGLYAWLWKVGVRPSEQLIIEQIRAIPAFFNQITGAFDEDEYNRRLAEANLTAPVFERGLRDEMSANHFAAALVAGSRAPRVYGALMASVQMQSRDGRWFFVTQDMAGTAPAPTDAQLTAFMNENAEALRRPEMRRTTLVLFTPSQQLGQVSVTDAQIQERFNFRRDALGQPETRTFVTIAARDRAAADRIAQALRAGQDPAAVAEANGVEPVAYDNRPASAVADQAVRQAVFGMQPGQVSNPIQGSLGLTVAKLTSITPGRAATLEDNRAAIEQELRQEAARARVYEQVEAFQQARDGGASITEAAQRTNGQVVQLPYLTEQGIAENGQRLGAPESVFQTAFATEAGGESDIVDAGEGQYFALRVEDVREAALPPLEEVRPQLTDVWTRRENARLLQAKADELAGRVRGGEDIAAVAASAGADLVTRTGVSVQTAGETPQGVLQGLFGQGRGQVFSGPADQTRMVVGRVDAVHAPTAALAARPAEQARPRLTMGLMNELTEIARSQAGEAVKVRTYPDQAQRALGIDPEAAPAEGGEGAADAPAE
ncbi:SurA N-terminal domain-containing protein [Brevundimonas sp. 2R-24]|uniref:Parvulin-like PPIase n=1 Tax=Peiella sedimenti TaxID=3061083 RepID=A0ABT8SL17_9CAUL|nr:SurA N-terminal domain-containing protein [Caulobacteraceae bacterium XZ-24]